MTNQSTIDKLIEMRLTSMADAFRIQLDDATMKEVPFEDRFGACHCIFFFSELHKNFSDYSFAVYFLYHLFCVSGTLYSSLFFSIVIKNTLNH